MKIDKRVIGGIAIAAILLLVIISLSMKNKESNISDSGDDNDNSNTDNTDEPAIEEYSDLQTSGDTFAEIDSALEFLE